MVTIKYKRESSHQYGKSINEKVVFNMVTIKYKQESRLQYGNNKE